MLRCPLATDEKMAATSECKNFLEISFTKEETSATGWCPRSIAFSCCVYNSNFTMVFVADISIVYSQWAYNKFISGDSGGGTTL